MHFLSRWLQDLLMREYIYLIRNCDLYNIGRTENLVEVKKILHPGVLEAFMETNDAKTILKIIKNNYSEKLLPQSDYYRLSKAQFLECKQQLVQASSKDDFTPFFSGPRLLITLLITWVGISLLIIQFGIQPIFHQFN